MLLENKIAIIYGGGGESAAASPVAVLSSLYPVVTIGLARVYLHERIERLQQMASPCA